MLVGYPPFNGDNNTEIYNEVKKVDISFEGSGWNKVKPEGKIKLINFNQSLIF